MTFIVSYFFPLTFICELSSCSLKWSSYIQQSKITEMAFIFVITLLVPESIIISSSLPHSFSSPLRLSIFCSWYLTLVQLLHCQASQSPSILMQIYQISYCQINLKSEILFSFEPCASLNNVTQFSSLNIHWYGKMKVEYEHLQVWKSIH